MRTSLPGSIFIPCADPHASYLTPIRGLSNTLLPPSRYKRRVSQSLFQKSPLKNRAVHCEAIYDISPPITTVYVPKSRHSRENGNLEAGVSVGFELVKHPLHKPPCCLSCEGRN